MTNVEALEIQLEAMALGREHRALAEACRALAVHLDLAETFDDKAWREYRLALRALQEAVSDGGSDEFERLAEKLRGAEVSDPEDA